MQAGTLTWTAAAVGMLAYAPTVVAQCTNDAGAGDTAEGEVCAGDLYVDTTNGGCNSSPSVFTDVAADGGMPRTYCGSVSTYDVIETCDEDGDCPDGDCQAGSCVGASEPSVNRRDTDWYLISQAELAAFDTDGNGTVRITSAVTGEPGLDLTTFIFTVNFVECNGLIAFTDGCWDSTGGTGQTVASAAITISEEPSGVIVFVAPGLCTGQGIFDGFECTTGLNDYTVTIAADPVFEADPFTTCGDPAQFNLLRPCSEPNPGVNGCADPQCCAIVCTEFTPECCTNELGWIQQCADAAVDLGCAPICFAVGGACVQCLSTGNDETAPGYARVCADPYGSWTADDLGGGFGGNPYWGDRYKPGGGTGPVPLELEDVSYTNGFYFFQRDGNGNGVARELLSYAVPWQLFFEPDDSIFNNPQGAGSFSYDDNGDGRFDRFESTFTLTGPATGLVLDFALTQKIESGPDQIAVLTQTYVITNNGPDAVDFTLVRSMEGDLVWDVASNPSNDSVGTDANGTSCTYVFQGESGLPGTYVTISSDQATGYFAAKAGVDPDGGGPCPPMTDGSDYPLWDAYGVPCAWDNYVAGVGADVNGESGPGVPGCAQPCDGSIGLEIPVSGLAPAASTTVIVTTTYGAASPLGATCEPCLYDCGDLDGAVGIADFLAVLAQWGQTGGSCDFGLGAPGVGIEEFLAILANWGPCP